MLSMLPRVKLLWVGTVGLVTTSRERAGASRSARTIELRNQRMLTFLYFCFTFSAYSLISSHYSIGTTTGDQRWSRHRPTLTTLVTWVLVTVFKCRDSWICRQRWKRPNSLVELTTNSIKLLDHRLSICQLVWYLWLACRPVRVVPASLVLHPICWQCNNNSSSKAFKGYEIVVFFLLFIYFCFIIIELFYLGSEYVSANG